MGAARLRGLRRPHLLRKSAPVLRSRAFVEVSQAPGAGGIAAQTKAAPHLSRENPGCEDLRCENDGCQSRFPGAEEDPHHEGLTCPPRIKLRGVLRTAWWRRKSGRQNRRRSATPSRKHLLNTRSHSLA